MKKTREEIIEFLILDDYRYITETSDGRDYLEVLLRDGFMGYKHMTEHDLQKEYKDRIG